MDHLPVEKRKSLSFRDLMVVIIVMLAVVVLINAFTNWYLNLPGSPNEGYGVVQSKWNFILNSQTKYDWLILGDSSSGRVDPTLIANAFDSSAINLGVIGSMLVVNDAWMLNAYINKHGPPKHVLVVHVYDIWRRGLNSRLISTLGVVQLPWGFWNESDIQLNLSLHDYLNLIVQRYFPLYSRDQSIKFLVNGLMLGRLSWTDLAEPLSNHRKSDEELLKNFGLQLDTTPRPESVTQDFVGHSNSLKAERNFKISEFNKQALINMIELAELNDFDLYIANSPVYDRLANLDSFQQYYSELFAELKSITSSSTKAHLLFHSPQAYSLESMSTSVDHLLHPAAQDFTNRIVEAVRKVKSNE